MRLQTAADAASIRLSHATERRQPPRLRIVIRFLFSNFYISAEQLVILQYSPFDTCIP